MNFMQSFFSKRFVSTFTLIMLFFFTTALQAQQFTATSYVNNFVGTNANGGGQSWTQNGTWGTNTISYAQNNEMDMTINQNNWIYAENIFTTPIDISTNKIFQVTTKLTGYSGKYLLVYLVDAGGVITGTKLQSLIPLNSTYTTSSIDFGSMIVSGFNFAAVKGLRFYIVDNAGGSIISNLVNAHLFFSNITLGSGATNTSTTTVERWTGDAQNINIYNANTGNVSIGTNPASEPTLSTAYYKFNVKGRTNFIADVNAVSIWSPTTQVNGYRHYMTFGIEKFANGIEYGVIGANEYNSGAMTAKPKHLLLQTNTTSGGANVGIGAFSVAPTAKLSINPGTNVKAIGVVNSSGVDVFRVTNTGIIYATELRIRLTPFPDYVFQNNYSLMPLDSVANYIQQEKHLPNMPSASQIEKDEIGIGEITRLQQEKIEELTLYIIEINKRLIELEARNRVLETISLTK
jgi:hypothetical protein